MSLSCNQEILDVKKCPLRSEVKIKIYVDADNKYFVLLNCLNNQDSLQAIVVQSFRGQG